MQGDGKMKKRYILTAVGLIAWLVRFYQLNGTFAVHEPFPVRYYDMHETISFDNCISYEGSNFQGYTVSVESASVKDIDEYINEYHLDTSTLPYVHDKYLELTFTITNTGNTQEPFNLHNLPVNGSDWYQYADTHVAAQINPEIEWQSEYIDLPVIREHETVTIKSVYGASNEMFADDRIEHLDQEQYTVTASVYPEMKVVRIVLDEQNASQTGSL